MAAALERAVARIAAAPRPYPVAEDAPDDTEVRNLILKRPPYRVVYAFIDGAIVVIAVAHTSRAPGYWHRRLPPAQRGD